MKIKIKYSQHVMILGSELHDKMSWEVAFTLMHSLFTIKIFFFFLNPSLCKKPDVE